MFFPPFSPFPFIINRKKMKPKVTNKQIKTKKQEREKANNMPIGNYKAKALETS